MPSPKGQSNKTKNSRTVWGIPRDRKKELLTSSSRSLNLPVSRRRAFSEINKPSYPNFSQINTFSHQMIWWSTRSHYFFPLLFNKRKQRAERTNFLHSIISEKKYIPDEGITTINALLYLSDVPIVQTDINLCQGIRRNAFCFLQVLKFRTFSYNHGSLNIHLISIRKWFLSNVTQIMEDQWNGDSEQ